ncbi:MULTISPECIES: FAD:protein FMN transferase [Cupriavidus]
MQRVLIPLSLGAAPPVPDATARVRRLHGESMGTTWSVAWAAPARGPDAAVLDAGIRAALAAVVAQMSNWEAASDLSRFNRAAPGAWQALPEDCFAVLQAALQVARDSGGAYDPSAGPLVDLWGFGPAPRRDTAPLLAEIEQARALCGWQRIELDAPGRRARQPGGARLDFCAIAKGFGVDAVARYLHAQGIASHLVEVGGELRGHGVKPDGLPWWVELETPPADGPADAANAGNPAAGATLVALHGLAVATSGDYRRYFDSAGRRYAHTLDPRTGYPASHALASVTVLHPQCMMADALSTALTVLGPEAGMVFARRHALAARFLVRRSGGFDERLSPAFAAMLV